MEIKKEATEISIQSIRFLVRHPWLFVCPFVIISSLTFSYVSNMPLDYECTAAISFGSASGNVLERKGDNRRDAIVGSLFFGNNLAKVIKDVWPGIDEKKNPVQYNGVANRLRNPQSGMIFRSDRRNSSVMFISFSDQDPKLCYKVVKSVIAVIKEGGKSVNEGNLETGLVFLRQQLAFYKDKLKAIDEESSKLRSKLQKMSSELSMEDRNLVAEVTSDTKFKENSGQLFIQQSVKYEEILAGLNLELLELNKSRESIIGRLERKDFSKVPLSLQQCMEDAIMKQYEGQIAIKELALTDLLSKGYTLEHPDASKLSAAISDLRALQEKRIRILTGIDVQELSGNDKNLAEVMMKSELISISSRIETLKSKIDLIGGYQKSSEGKLKSPGSSQGTAVYADASRLTDLKNEKEINFKYYVDIRRQLEEVEMKARVEESDVGLSVDVVVEPIEPTMPNSRKKGKLFIMGFVMAIIAGGGLAYIVDYLDKSIRSPEELRSILKIPVLASVERMLTMEDVRQQKMRRKAIILGLFVFVVLSNVIMKLLF